VNDSTPAAQAGIKQGDRINKVNGHETKCQEDYFTAMRSVHVGDSVPFEILRDNKRMDIRITLGDAGEAQKETRRFAVVALEQAIATRVVNVPPSNDGGGASAAAAAAAAPAAAASFPTDIDSLTSTVDERRRDLPLVDEDEWLLMDESAGDSDLLPDNKRMDVHVTNSPAPTASPGVVVLSSPQAVGSNPMVDKLVLGMAFQTNSGELGGLLISSVAAGEAAEVAGLRTGDRVRNINGVTTTGHDDYLRALSSVKPGQTVNFEVERDGSRFPMPVVVGGVPETAPQTPPNASCTVL